MSFKACKFIETHLEGPKFPRGGYYTDGFDLFCVDVSVEEVEDFLYDYSSPEES